MMGKGIRRWKTGFIHLPCCSRVIARAVAISVPVWSVETVAKNNTEDLHDWEYHAQINIIYTYRRAHTLAR